MLVATDYVNGLFDKVLSDPDEEDAGKPRYADDDVPEDGVGEQGGNQLAVN